MNNKSIYDMTLDELKRIWVIAIKEEKYFHAVRRCLEIYIHRKEKIFSKDSGVENE